MSCSMGGLSEGQEIVGSKTPISRVEVVSWVRPPASRKRVTSKSLGDESPCHEVVFLGRCQVKTTLELPRAAM